MIAKTSMTFIAEFYPKALMNLLYANDPEWDKLYLKELLEVKLILHQNICQFILQQVHFIC